ncbi:serine acetyltransferase [Stutzerimonas stutzeri]|uniref:serine acetyltransferase n=1 Tax=Stutzerimonas TaxID=2901164 RepID=UPI001BAF9920|nr:serine acetyltransferase [Stutzerimonas stutzeri]QUE75398.1 serine acetyltransferase [Stutzerimonas stutzeri]
MMPMLKSMKRYWCLEILGGSPKEFSWRRLRQKCKRSNRYAYLFWFRIAYVLHAEGGRFWKRRAKMLNERISRKYNVEIMLGATVGEGLWIAHPSGIVISAYSKIGKNFKIWQGCTIGIKGGDGEKFIFIGDNVSLCVNSCIIGDAISIADNVVIGAMTLVNKDISSAGIYVNKRVLDGFGCGSEAQSSS